MAQLAAHLAGSEKVPGSGPGSSTAGTLPISPCPAERAATSAAPQFSGDAAAAPPDGKPGDAPRGAGSPGTSDRKDDDDRDRRPHRMRPDHLLVYLRHSGHGLLYQRGSLQDPCLGLSQGMRIRRKMGDPNCQLTSCSCDCDHPRLLMVSCQKNQHCNVHDNGCHRGCGTR